MKYNSYLEVAEAFEQGELKYGEHYMVVDNDECFVYDNDECVFQGNPITDFHDLLDIISIPSEAA